MRFRKSNLGLVLIIKLHFLKVNFTTKIEQLKKRSHVVWKGICVGIGLKKLKLKMYVQKKPHQS